VSVEKLSKINISNYILFLWSLKKYLDLFSNEGGDAYEL